MMSNMTRRSFMKLVPTGVLATGVLAACATKENVPPPKPTPDVTSPEFTAREYLTAWRADDFDKMYDMLSFDTQANLTREAFEGRYQGVLEEATVYEFEANVVAAQRFDARNGAAEFDLLYRTRLAGDLQFRARLAMVVQDDLEGTSEWRIQWTPAVIIPSLGTENRLQLFPTTSTRGTIYDRNGEVLARQSAIVTIGVVPGQIVDAESVHSLVSELSELSTEEVSEKYLDQPDNWFVPIVDIPFERSQENYDRLINTPGISLRNQATRIYPQKEVACHLVGFVGQINTQELIGLGQRGYTESDSVGKQGIERAAEELLAGKKGGRLVVLNPAGQEIETLANIEAVHSRDLYMSLDMNLQRICEEVLGERKGSITVADVATGQVLGMSSWPRYDPNIMANVADPVSRQAITNSPDQPLLNRATQGTYPSGSLFKIITMAAGMELAGLPHTNGHNCTGVWTKLGFPMECWKKEGHGNIDLFHGLEQSCNIVFFETGEILYNTSSTALQEMASAFGVGQFTGIETDEITGLLPSDEWKQEVYDDAWRLGDTVNLSIGQGFLQTTPAQMTRMVLSLAAGGLRRQLTLLNSSKEPGKSGPLQPISQPEPEPLPLSANTLNSVRGAMRAVAVPPWGTASGVFTASFPIQVAGKTGTAESGGDQLSHAWFAGFAPYDQPQIAFVSMLEYGGEGSADAAPMIKETLIRYYGLDPNLLNEAPPPEEPPQEGEQPQEGEPPPEGEPPQEGEIPQKEEQQQGGEQQQDGGEQPQEGEPPQEGEIPQKEEQPQEGEQPQDGGEQPQDGGEQPQDG